MADNSRVVTGGSISFSTLLLAAFIVLKLTNVITWGWVWVLAPFWIPLVIIVVLVIFSLAKVIFREME